MSRRLPGPRFTVVVSGSVEDDVDEIAAYIAHDSLEAALRVVDRIESAISSLDRWPRRHPLAREGVIDGREMRNALVGSYRVIFSVDDRTVTVHGVRHSARTSLE